MKIERTADLREESDHWYIGLRIDDTDNPYDYENNYRDKGEEKKQFGPLCPHPRFEEERKQGLYIISVYHRLSPD